MIKTILFLLAYYQSRLLLSRVAMMNWYFFSSTPPSVNSAVTVSFLYYLNASYLAFSLTIVY